MGLKFTGYALAGAAVILFAGQDAFSRVLVEHYPPAMITMVRFWIFALFVLTLAAFSPAGLIVSARTRQPAYQLARGVLLATQIILAVYAYSLSGLALTQAILQSSPLFVTLLSIPVLGERVGWWRAGAVIAGLLGVMIIINPLRVRADAGLLVALAAAVAYSMYGVLTRAVSRTDSAVTSVLYVSVVGSMAASLVGAFLWVPIQAQDWPTMLALCACGSFSHYLLIKAYTHLTAV